MKRKTLKVIQKITRGMVNFPVIGFWSWRLIRYVRKALAIDINIVTEYDEDIKIKTNLADHMESRVFWQGFLEGDRGELLLLDELLSKDESQVFFDVGAHVGIFSMFAAKRIKVGDVHSFEPYKKHLERLRFNVELNNLDNVTIRRFVLGETEGKAKLKVPIPGRSDDPLLAGSGGSSIMPFEVNSDNYEIHAVNKTTLDKYVDIENIGRVDIIKVDVEGAELNVLKGGNGLLDRFRPHVLMELDQRYLERAGRTPDDVVDFWHRRDYTLHRIENDGSLSRLTSTDQLTTRQNILADPDTG